ncbi:glycosyltransferase [Runella aurantiaca]|uniref:Erythromycin biosynthesis protein CIII-like C-terminal domain-containing protein n=1 Tax=Runella aurantiaca TaxID=2282308 RepID=A0A369ID72_9BACT|nr:nucleotide disphospho-sugar-binding domain-containing protein [Runella aurantiaca]RDB07731.1 hypothetical protein DVG78_01360 [Runella aurantiaca]
MKTALFILLPYPSHYFVGFGKARQLKAQGYEVVFTGLSSHQTLIEREGFVFKPLRYASAYKHLSFRALIALLIQTLLNKPFSIQRYRTFWEEVRAIQVLADELQPEILLIDSHLGHYALYLWQVECTKMILNTKLSSYPEIGIPPLTEGWLANRNGWAIVRAWTGWQVHFLKRKWKQWLEKIAFLGKDDHWLLEKLAKKTGKKYLDWFDDNHCFYPAVKALPKLITYPEALEYPWKKPKAGEYYEAISFERNESHLLGESYCQLMAQLHLSKLQNPAIKIVYANFGTTGLNNNATGLQALDKLITVIQEMPNIRLIVSTNFIKNRNANNVYCLENVPQLDLLQHCDLMVSHGGLNSICECLQAGVPMLLCPLNHKADHFGNTERVVYHGLGLKGNLTTETTQSIKIKIETVLYNPTYRNRLHCFLNSAPTYDLAK